MPVDTNPLASDHEYEIVTSDSGPSVDGYRLGEPKELDCVHCDARMIITEDPTPGLWSVCHEPTCRNVSE